MGVHRVLGVESALTVAWQITDSASVENALIVFENLMVEGKLAFARTTNDPAAKTTRIERFDPWVDEIIWVNPLMVT
jgi:hypothetical protein